MDTHTYIYTYIRMCTHRPINANIQIISSPQINYQYKISKRFCVRFSRVTVSMAHMQAHMLTQLSACLHMKAGPTQGYILLRTWFYKIVYIDLPRWLPPFGLTFPCRQYSIWA